MPSPDRTNPLDETLTAKIRFESEEKSKTWLNLKALEAPQSTRED